MPRAPRRRVRGTVPRSRAAKARAARVDSEFEVDVKEELTPMESVKTELEADVIIKAELGSELELSLRKSEAADVEPEFKPELDVEDAWKPLGWERVLDGVRAMRSKRAAPVDSMGCERAGGKEADILEPRTVRYQHLVALMLSSQTRDEVTAGAVDRLRAALDPTLTPEAILATPEETLAELIHPVGFFRRKAVYLRNAARICIEKYDSDVPRTLNEITQLPGVGPKMGHLLLQAAWDDVQGIGVDVHVHRLANLWKWVPQPTRTPEQTRMALEKWLPRELWQEINPLLVGFGQTWCPPRLSSNSCSRCELNGICPAVKQ